MVLVVGGVLAIIVAVLVLNLQTPPERRIPLTPNRPAPPNSNSIKPEVGPAPAPAPPREPKPDPPIAAPPPVASAVPGTSTVTQTDLDYLATRNLLVPVEGVKANQLRDTFNQARSEGRQHDAIDIMAPQGLPVLAADEGTVIKLFQSERGGITLYQIDPSGRYVYYYAHLARYAEGIAEGKQVRRGDVIAYVGDTGNAGPGNFHLHFAISKITSPRQWSGGDPINPYPLLAR
ncbi:MAG: endopeptidase [Acidobacteria bacterium]|nr:MAG: endopeptidase [Acidobacteriota bacterium]